MVGILLVLCTFSLLFLLCPKSGDNGRAHIYVNGELYETIPLNTADCPYPLPHEIIINNGTHSNTILIEEGQISMVDANCPDRLCVSMGAIKDSRLPIVCLPHNVVIIIEETSETALDAVTY